MNEQRRAIARAIDALRRGWPVRISGATGSLELLAIESADDGRLSEFDPAGDADVLLSGHRATTLRLANQRDAASPAAAVRVGRVPWLDLPVAMALADPALDLATPLKGPFRAVSLAEQDAAQAGLRLARLAGLLPAFFVRSLGSGNIEAVAAEGIAAYEAPSAMTIAARARLPVVAAEDAEIVAFRSAEDAVEHVALLLGSPGAEPPLVRLHSECLTGDVLGSLKCDCGPQLNTALETMRAAGGGILIYLRQEGRGIGLVNKLRAYALQDQGFDTVDANTRLGFEIDERDFAAAARMLSLLGVDNVRLLTNNPAKCAGLEAAGVSVVERVPLAVEANVHNHGYLAAKRDRTGHLL